MQVLYVVKSGLVVDGQRLAAGLIVKPSDKLYAKIEKQLKIDTELNDKTRVLRLDTDMPDYDQIVADLPKEKKGPAKPILETGLKIKQVLESVKPPKKLTNAPIVLLNDGQPKLVAKTKEELDQEALSGERQPSVEVLPKVEDLEDKAVEPEKAEIEDKPKRGRKKSE